MSDTPETTEHLITLTKAIMQLMDELSQLRKAWIVAAEYAGTQQRLIDELEKRIERLETRAYGMH